MVEFPQRWGAYVLIRPLGSGGMGSVFLALRRIGAEETVCVVKRLTAETLTDSGRRERFGREGEISRTLAEDGIARTIEIGEYDGEPYLAQEFVEGRTVAQVCSAAASFDERLFPLMVAYIGERVGRALAHAHRLGVVHRDIAPSNVMVGFDGAVSLIDFGIARRATDASLTATGEFVGRAAYTAPEVLVGAEADPRSDIYSLGVLLWELLVGRAPAFGELRARPTPSSLAPDADIPADLDDAVIRALAPDPSDRFRSAEEFAEALGQLRRRAQDGKEELARLIWRCYEVPSEREQLRSEVAEARELLPREAGASPETAVSARRVRGSHRARWIAGVLVAGGLGWATILALRPHEPVRTSARSVAPTILSPPPRPQVLGSVPASPGPSPAPEKAVKRARATKPISIAARAPAPVKHGPAQASTLEAGILLDRARDCLAAGDISEASRQATLVLEDGSAHQRSAAHLILGKALLFGGRKQEAGDEFAAAVQLDPENGAAIDQLAALRRRGTP